MAEKTFEKSYNMWVEQQFLTCFNIEKETLLDFIVIEKLT